MRSQAGRREGRANETAWGTRCAPAGNWGAAATRPSMWALGALTIRALKEHADSPHPQRLALLRRAQHVRRVAL